MKAIAGLLETMRALRHPETGCPWDREQTMTSILPYTLEEVYELVDAIERGETPDIRDELGDLLFHVVYYAQMAEEAGSFDFSGIAEHADTKLKRRHPHVFGDAEAGPPRAQAAAWEEIKREERRRAGKADTGLLDGVNRAAPALQTAFRLQKQAALAGFDWKDISPVLEKVEEELGEIRRELEADGDRRRLAGEIGDLLFTCVNLARHAGADPETALRATNRKFMARFSYIEARLAEQGTSVEETDLDELEALWQESKDK
jgi:ATP diphosphatase